MGLVVLWQGHGGHQTPQDLVLEGDPQEIPPNTDPQAEQRAGQGGGDSSDIPGDMWPAWQGVRPFVPL